jgi:hypothetical protein
VDCCGINSTEAAAGKTSGSDAASASDAANRSAQPEAEHGSAAPHWKRVSALIAAALVALVPKCPACWSVYAGLSNLLGVSIALDDRYLRPLTLVALGVALFGLGSGVRRSGYLAFGVATVCALGIWLGKFELNNDVLLGASSAGLLLAACAARRARRAQRARSAASSELAEHAQAG